MSTPEPHTPTTTPFPDETKCDAASCARDRIFQAAKKLFYQFGIRGVSVDSIAAEADTTKVTLYRVFESKDDLVKQVIEDQSRRFWEWWDSIIAQHPNEPRAQIEALFAAFRDRICGSGVERGCPVSNAAVEVIDDDDPAKQLIRTHKLEVNRRLRALCTEMGAGAPEVLGDALSLLVNGVFAARLCCDDKEQIESVYDAAKALLESPLGVPRGS
jgi:AcrR family transcriptional regulator